jgi:predicted nuclease of predicted toxin-antitoxin system
MHFLFDENMPLRLAKGLEILDADNEFGKPPVHKISHIYDHYDPGANDPDVVKLARKLKAVVVSEDDDYKNITVTCQLVKKLRVGYVWFKLPKKTGSNYDEQVLAFIKAWPELKKQLKNKKPPYMFIIERDGKVREHEAFRR